MLTQSNATEQHLKRAQLYNKNTTLAYQTGVFEMFQYNMLHSWKITKERKKKKKKAKTISKYGSQDNAQLISLYPILYWHKTTTKAYLSKNTGDKNEQMIHGTKGEIKKSARRDYDSEVHSLKGVKIKLHVWTDDWAPKQNPTRQVKPPDSGDEHTGVNVGGVRAVISSRVQPTALPC